MRSSGLSHHAGLGCSKEAGETSRLVELDGLRGLAILMVLQFHWAEGLSRMTRTEAVMYEILRAGWLGVDLFFVLSGFLITGILWDSRTTVGYFRKFYIRRALRIFPPYYGFLVFSWGVLPWLLWFIDHKPMWQSSGQWWYWLYVSNIGMALHAETASDFFSHFWSLAVEEQFYLFWPLVVYHLSSKAVVRTCLGLITCAAVLRSILLWCGGAHPGSYVLMPCRLDALAIGAWLAMAQRLNLITADFLWWARGVFWIGMGVLAGVFCVSGFKLEIANPYMVTVGYSIAGLTCGALMILILRRGWIPWVKTPILQVFGKYSYTIYIIHVPLHAPLYKIYASQHITGLMWSDFGNLIGFCIFASIACLIIAALSWRLYESHFLKLKDRFA